MWVWGLTDHAGLAGEIFNFPSLQAGRVRGLNYFLFVAGRREEEEANWKRCSGRKKERNSFHNVLCVFHSLLFLHPQLSIEKQRYCTDASNKVKLSAVAHTKPRPRGNLENNSPCGIEPSLKNASSHTGYSRNNHVHEYRWDELKKKYPGIWRHEAEESSCNARSGQSLQGPSFQTEWHFVLVFTLLLANILTYHLASWVEADYGDSC